MTPIDSTHAGLLKGLAKNLTDVTARRVYSDYLQEQGNAGWYVVANYDPDVWPLWGGGETGWWVQRGIGECWEEWHFPWLEGVCHFDMWVQQRRNLIKRMLKAYAEGDVR